MLPGSFDEPLDLAGQLFQVGDAQRHRHPFPGRERVDHDRDGRADGVLEQERRAAPLHHPVGDLGDLEFGIDPRGDALQLAGPLQRPKKLLKTAVGHGSRAVSDSVRNFTSSDRVYPTAGGLSRRRR
jgi:hypothetical protein